MPCQHLALRFHSFTQLYYIALLRSLHTIQLTTLDLPHDPCLYNTPSFAPFSPPWSA